MLTNEARTAVPVPWGELAVRYTTSLHSFFFTARMPPSSGVADRMYVSCTVQLSQDLMPDALHPNAAGMRLLAECILPFLKLYAPVKKHAGLSDMPH